MNKTYLLFQQYTQQIFEIHLLKKQQRRFSEKSPLPHRFPILRAAALQISFPFTFISSDHQISRE